VAIKPEESIPWEELMAIALGVLNLTPKTFWAMTPAEFKAIYNGRMELIFDLPPTREQIKEFMQKFPD